MTLHVYENWTIRRAVIHQSDCTHCNNGQGKHAGSSNRHGRWLGPFATYETAAEVAQQTGQPVRDCGHYRAGRVGAPRPLTTGRARRVTSGREGPVDGRSSITRRQTTLDRIRGRLDDLTSRFGFYVDVFERADWFTGPSRHFHIETIRLLRASGSPADALRSDLFLDYLYATLTSWGMHRMGRTDTKLVDVEPFRETLRAKASAVQRLAGSQIGGYPEVNTASVASAIWEVIEGLRVATGETKIVANSKALHHLLPDLVPPVDREYTLKFFFNHGTLNAGDETTFKELYPHFDLVARRCRDEINALTGSGWQTSPTKVIDSAIIGHELIRRKLG